MRSSFPHRGIWRFIVATVLLGASNFSVGQFVDPVIVVPPPPPPIPLPAPATRAAAPLINLSVRTTITGTQIFTAGFVVGGSERRRVLIRVVGDGLQRFGITPVLRTPYLTLFDGSVARQTANGWDSQLAPLFQAVGAFPLTSGRDIALLTLLEPKAYTVQVMRSLLAPDDDPGGEVLVEVYFVD